MHKYRILTIDDDPKNNDLIRNYGMKTREHTIDSAINISDGIELIRINHYDLLTLDIELKGENGLKSISKIKEVYGGPIIFVSAMSDAENILQGFEEGADDFLKKPFNPEELFLRIERSIQRHGTYRLVSVSNYQIDEINEKVLKDDIDLELKPLTAKLFILLLKNKNKVLTREEIFQKVWDGDYTFSTRVIDTHISILRHHTEDIRIKSIRGKGYAFMDD